MKKSELRSLVREELKNVMKEGDTYRRIKSDINETWDDLKTVENDLYNFLENTFDSGGTEDLKNCINAIIKAVNKAKPLLTKDKVYGEWEAAAKISNDSNIEAVLKKVKGYESIVSGGMPGTAFVYFGDKQSAIAGAKVLKKMVPGPDYENNIVNKDGIWVIQIKAR